MSTRPNSNAALVATATALGAAAGTIITIVAIAAALKVPKHLKPLLKKTPAPAEPTVEA